MQVPGVLVVAAKRPHDVVLPYNVSEQVRTLCYMHTQAASCLQPMLEKLEKASIAAAALLCFPVPLLKGGPVSAGISERSGMPQRTMSACIW